MQGPTRCELEVPNVDKMEEDQKLAWRRKVFLWQENLQTPDQISVAVSNHLSRITNNAIINISMDVTPHPEVPFFLKPDRVIDQRENALSDVAEWEGYVYCFPPHNLVTQFMKKGLKEILKKDTKVKGLYFFLYRS